MIHRVHHRFHQSVKNNPTTSLLIAALAVLLGIILLLQPVARPVVSSVEVKFTDASHAGLSIVPASCPSVSTNPDYPHNTCAQTNPGQCTIRFSDALITDGESSTLTWQWNPAQSTFPPSYSSGSITPTIGSVGPSGSHLVSPHVTTVYQYNGTSLSFFGLIRRSFSCSGTLTVTAATTDQCLNIDGVQETVPPNYIRDSSGDCFPQGDACVITPRSKAVALGSATVLDFTSTGYPATIDHGIGSVSANGSRSTGDLNSDTTFTMSVPATGTTCNTPVIKVCAAGEMVQNGLCVPRSCSARCYSCGTGANADRLYYTDYTPPLCTPETNQSMICFYGCSSSANCSAACNLPSTFEPSVTIEARPSLVQQGTKVLVSWRTVDAQASTCRVTGTNGDGKGINSTGWAGLARGSKDSSPINSQTVYTISCTMRNGLPMSQSATVNIVPREIET